jgi:DNA-binding transcriptional regulator YbjK
MTDRRSQLADAALATLAASGMRGLTHRAVDAAAGVAEGSTSYYFRTRQALLEAAVARMAELDLGRSAALSPTSGPRTPDSLAEFITRWLTVSLREGRTVLLARYELALESTRRPELRDMLIRAGAAFRDLAAGLLAAMGAEDPARRGRDLVAYLDGLLFDEIAGAGAGTLTPDRLAAAVRDLVRVALG